MDTLLENQSIIERLNYENMTALKQLHFGDPVGRTQNIADLSACLIYFATEKGTKKFKKDAYELVPYEAFSKGITEFLSSTKQEPLVSKSGIPFHPNKTFERHLFEILEDALRLNGNSLPENLCEKLFVLFYPKLNRGYDGSSSSVYRSKFQEVIRSSVSGFTIMDDWTNQINWSLSPDYVKRVKHGLVPKQTREFTSALDSIGKLTQEYLFR